MKRTSLVFPSRALILAFGAFAAAAARARATPPQPPVITDVSPRIGTVLGGTAVTFTGSSFSPPMSVLFGQSAALNCTTPVNGSFTCNTPPAPIEGLVDVTVVNKTGNTSTVIPSDFRYTCAQCTVFPTLGLVEGAVPGGTTEPNGILEPGETDVSFAPSWFNNSGDTISSMTGALSELSQDSSYSFTASTSTGAYNGPIAPLGGVGACNAPCYRLSFSFTGARPQTHVDVSMMETPSISGGLSPDSDDAHRWTIHVGNSFSDVPSSNVFYTAIETLLHNEVTFGTGGGLFSPNLEIPRGQMAAFLARGLAGNDANIPAGGTISPTTNPAVSGSYDCADGGASLFADVSPTDPFCRQIHYIAAANITGGCDSTPDFCPDQTVTRWQMAVLVARALVSPGGDALVPSAHTGTGEFSGRSYDCVNGPAPFSDVALSDGFCKHVGYIWTLGIVDGFGDGTYGPTLPTTRGQMAKFIVNAFHLSITKPPRPQGDLLLAGNSISVHPGSFSASASGTFLLPSGKDAPTTGGATLRVFDTGAGSGAANFPGTGGAQIITLAAPRWTIQSTASGPKFVYTGAVGDPCTSVTISSAGKVTASCATTLQTPFSGDAALILDAGASRFCAAWEGTTTKNDATGLTRSDSPPPARCPAVEAAPQATQFTAPVFANGLTVYQLFPLHGAKAPNVDALTITKVTQPLLRMWSVNTGGGASAGCQPLVEPVPCTRQIGVVSIAPDGKSLVYDLNPGQAPQPVPSFPEATREPLGATCNLGTIDPANMGTIGTAANPSLYCVRGDETALLGFDLGPLSPTDPCDDRISQWPFPFQFTISDGVTESTQTMILTMYDHSCIPVNLTPPPITTLHPSLEPPQLVFGPAGSPTVDIDVELAPISITPVSSGLPGGSGGSFTVPAHCPDIPNVSNPICTGSGTISADPSSLLLASSAGTVVRLNQPLTLTTYSPISDAGFNSVTLVPAKECINCYLKTQLMTLFQPSSTCGYLLGDGTTVRWVDCITGVAIGGTSAPLPTK